MQLVNPGLWTIIGFFGLFLSALGASLLAYNQMNATSNKLKHLQRKKFGADAYSALESLVENKTELQEGEGFEELVTVLTQDEAKYRLGLSVDSQSDIAKIGYNNRTVNGHFLYIIGDSGEEHEQKIRVQRIMNEIDKVIESNFRSFQDSAIRFYWEVLAVGFVLQLISYFVRNFIR